MTDRDLKEEFLGKNPGKFSDGTIFLSDTIILGSFQINVKTKDIECLFWAIDMYLEFPQ